MIKIWTNFNENPTKSEIRVQKNSSIYAGFKIADIFKIFSCPLKFPVFMRLSEVFEAFWTRDTKILGASPEIPNFFKGKKAIKWENFLKNKIFEGYIFFWNVQIPNFYIYIILYILYIYSTNWLNKRFCGKNFFPFFGKFLDISWTWEMSKMSTVFKTPVFKRFSVMSVWTLKNVLVSIFNIF